MRTVLTLLLISLAAGQTGCTSKPESAAPAKVGASPSAHSHPEDAGYYTCSMHPNVRSDKPGKCPICHMDLIKVAPQAPKAAAGRESIALTPQQELLSGTRPIEVRTRALTREIRAPGRVITGNRISFQVFEQDLASVRIGLPFDATAPSLPGEPLRGRITSVETLLDPMTRTARVNGILSDPEAARLLTESSVSGTIRVPLGEVTAIPESAVLHTGTESLVFVSDGQGGYRPQRVRLGAKAQGYYAVKDGVGPGELISAGPNFLLDSEARIRGSTGQGAEAGDDSRHH